MGTCKYYTRFLCHHDNNDDCEEYTGVVELSSPFEKHADIGEIESLLYRSLDFEGTSVKNVEVLDFTPLH
ncbi:MAG: hypothetical protein QF535_21530 [Anaerolineales bacterium]|jgi:hypothetical protein|nr:hypothetical protein [Anaerolineales bacterium]